MLKWKSKKSHSRRAGRVIVEEEEEESRVKRWMEESQDKGSKSRIGWKRVKEESIKRDTKK